jgi:hypothetical protein
MPVQCCQQLLSFTQWNITARKAPPHTHTHKRRSLTPPHTNLLGCGTVQYM